MARKLRIPKPWPRKDRNNDWYVTIRQRQHYLAPANATMEEVQHALSVLLMDSAPEKKGDQAEVVSLFGRFLEHVERDQDPKTFRLRRHYLHSFVASLKKNGEFSLKVLDIKPYHITQWVKPHKTWGLSTQRMAMVCVTTALNWGVKEGYVDKNPLKGRMDYPANVSRGREVYLDEDTYKEWLGWCRHPQQRHLLIALYRTGCRPGEVISLGAAPGTGLDARQRCWLVQTKKTRANPGGFRSVMLDSFMVELSLELRRRYPHGAMFRNSRDTPWRNEVVAHLFERLREKSAKHHPERGEYYAKLVPYGCRHTWATNRLIEGESDTLVARHLGHCNTSMLHQHYSHVLSEDARHLAEKQKRVDGEAV